MGLEEANQFQRLKADDQFRQSVFETGASPYFSEVATLQVKKYRLGNPNESEELARCLRGTMHNGWEDLRRVALLSDDCALKYCTGKITVNEFARDLKPLYQEFYEQTEGDLQAMQLYCHQHDPSASLVGAACAWVLSAEPSFHGVSSGSSARFIAEHLLEEGFGRASRAYTQEYPVAYFIGAGVSAIGVLYLIEKGV